ncbi:MAG: DUF4267 domain-containing protein [Hyphomicrobiales bacterium]
MSSTLYLFLILAGVANLMFLGFAYLNENKKLIVQTGHTIEGMTQVVGGRYLMMAALVLGLYLFADRASLGVAFASFAFVAIVDILIERRHGGKLYPHAIAAFASVVMSVVSFNMAKAEGL